MELSESDIQRYDRQIRVWGKEAQGKIQKAKIFVSGIDKLNIEVTDL